MIFDEELQAKLIKKISKLRELNQAVGDTQIRQAIDARLTEAYLLARDGHLQNLNGGKGVSNELGRCLACGGYHGPGMQCPKYVVTMQKGVAP